MLENSENSYQGGHKIEFETRQQINTGNEHISFPNLKKFNVYENSHLYDNNPKNSMNLRDLFVRPIDVSPITHNTHNNMREIQPNKITKISRTGLPQKKSFFTRFKFGK